MTLLRALLLALAVALAVEAAIYYALVALGAGEQAIIEIEMVWLCVSAFFGVAFVDRFDHTDDERRNRPGPRSH